MKRLELEISEFRGDFAFLSNFYHCEVVYDGILYPSVEHAYQASKTNNRELRQKIANTDSPSFAKKQGRGLRLRHDFESSKLKIMKELLRIKFEDLLLGTWLLNTENANLIEGNDWGDTYWGQMNGIGENHLGKLLMEVREEMRAKSQG